ncbi:MAG: hypothetical protein PHQ04_04115 [Opitutaceae bacterium]|nr:hypothetical protein [Opitutaceae bacterium]
MTLRRRESEPVSAEAEPCVVVSGHPVPVVRFELVDRTISYLTAELKQWELTSLGQEDKLRIKAGGDWVAITGRGLAAARDALDQARLQKLREAPARRAALTDDPWVQAIKVETAKAGAIKVEPQ